MKDYDKNEYPYLQDMSPKIEKIILYGLLIVVIFIGGFFVWATVAPLQGATVTQGRMIVDTNRKTIQHLEGGIVKEISVKEGAVVKKGDLLMVLEPTQPMAQLDMLKTKIVTLSALKARLESERDTLDEIKFPDQLMKHIDDPDVKKAITTENEIFKNKGNNYKNTIKILQQRIQQLNDEIESLQSQVKSANIQLVYMQEEHDAVEQLEQRKIVERPRLLALKRSIAKLEGDRDEQIALIARTKQKIGETELEMIHMKQEDRKDTLDNLWKAQNELSDALEQVKSATDIYQRTFIRAPLDGIVVNLKVFTEGGVINPGQVVMDIVPSRDKLIVETRIQPNDIDVVHPGLKAKVQLSAYKARAIPTLNGEVLYVSADALTDERNDTAYYLAKVNISMDELAALKGVRLYPGMPVEVMIINDKRTPLKYLLRPLQDSMNRAFREQ